MNQCLSGIVQSPPKCFPGSRFLSFQPTLKLLNFLKMRHSPTTCLLRHTLSYVQVTTSQELLQVITGEGEKNWAQFQKWVLSTSSKMLPKKLSELISDFSKAAEYKINLQKSVVCYLFLHTSNYNQKTKFKNHLW